MKGILNIRFWPKADIQDLDETLSKATSVFFAILK